MATKMQLAARRRNFAIYSLRGLSVRLYNMADEVPERLEEEMLKASVEISRLTTLVAKTKTREWVQ